LAGLRRTESLVIAVRVSTVLAMSLLPVMKQQPECQHAADRAERAGRAGP
jgi:hypothetical protein